MEFGCIYDLIVNTSAEYTSYDLNNKNKVNEISFNEKGAFEIVYNLDYSLLKKFTVSAIASYYNFNRPSLPSLKIGSAIKFLYVDNKYHCLTLQYSHHIPFSKNHFIGGSTLI